MDLEDDERLDVEQSVCIDIDVRLLHQIVCWRIVGYILQLTVSDSEQV